MPFASIYSTTQGPICKIFSKKYWELRELKKSGFFWVGNFEFIFLLHPHENQSKFLGKQGWAEIFMITLVPANFLLCVKLRYTVYLLLLDCTPALMENLGKSCRGCQSYFGDIYNLIIYLSLVLLVSLLQQLTKEPTKKFDLSWLLLMRGLLAINRPLFKKWVKKGLTIGIYLV